MKTWKEKVDIPRFGICTVKETTKTSEVKDKIVPPDSGFVNLYRDDKWVAFCGIDYAKQRKILKDESLRKIVHYTKFTPKEWFNYYYLDYTSIPVDLNKDFYEKEMTLSEFNKEFSSILEDSSFDSKYIKNALRLIKKDLRVFELEIAIFNIKMRLNDITI